MSMFFPPRAQILDVSGRPYPGAKAYFYQAGTSTPLVVYSDVALTVSISQPAVADSAGIFPGIYTPAGLYKVILTDASGVVIYTQDNVDPAVSTSLGAVPIAQGGTGATTPATALASLGAASAAALTATQLDIATNYYSKIVNPIATQAEALAGTDATRLMSALSVAQVLQQRGSAPQFWFRDEKPSGTAGGALATGADLTRTLNTVKINVLAGVSLAANQFVLPVGNFFVCWRAGGNQLGGHQTFLYNVTDGSVVERGSTEFCPNGSSVSVNSIGEAFFSITASKTFELRHRVANTGNAGLAASFGTEVYADLYGWQVQ